METLKYRVYVDEFQGGMGQHKKWIDSYHNTREEAEKRAKEIMENDIIKIIYRDQQITYSKKVAEKAKIDYGVDIVKIMKQQIDEELDRKEK